MTQNEKELLLKDLCARIPYGVKIHHAIPTLLISIKSDRDGMKIITEGSYGEHIFDIEDIKPYLRTMSSMTDEEIKTYHSYCECNDGDFTGEILYFDTIESFDYLASIHVDYRGLIPMGLAIEASKDMYNIK